MAGMVGDLSPSSVCVGDQSPREKRKRRADAGQRMVMVGRMAQGQSINPVVMRGKRRSFSEQRTG